MRVLTERAIASALATLCFFSLSPDSTAQAQKARSPEPCLTYGEVGISGTLKELRGVFILKPPRPLCARAQPGADRDDITAEPVDNAREIHVFATDETEHLRLRKWLNKKVIMTGTLGSAHTRYHRAPLILSVDRVKQE